MGQLHWFIRLSYRANLGLLSYWPPKSIPSGLPLSHGIGRSTLYTVDCDSKACAEYELQLLVRFCLDNCLRSRVQIVEANIVFRRSLEEQK